MALLEVRGLSVDYAGSPALRDVSLQIEPGEVVAVIGANGAGKTTLLRAIAGLKRANAGAMEISGRAVLGRPPQEIVARGVALVPQDRGLFPHMSVLDNLRVGGFLCTDRKELARRLEGVFARFPVLGERRRQPALTLSGGEQQMLAIGRALMGQPALLMLDEPSLALAPTVVKTIAVIIEQLRAGGTSVLLVEQNVRMALSVASRAYLLAAGAVVTGAPSARLLENEQVRDAYLGRPSAAPPAGPPPAAGTPHPSAAPGARHSSRPPGPRGGTGSTPPGPWC